LKYEHRFDAKYVKFVKIRHKNAAHVRHTHLGLYEVKITKQNAKPLFNGLWHYRKCTELQTYLKTLLAYIGKPGNAIILWHCVGLPGWRKHNFMLYMNGMNE